MNTANYVLNKFLFNPILKKTLYEILKGKMIKIFYFRAFSYKYFINSNYQEKLENLTQGAMKKSSLDSLNKEKHTEYTTSKPKSL